MLKWQPDLKFHEQFNILVKQNTKLVQLFGDKIVKIKCFKFLNSLIFLCLNG